MNRRVAIATAVVVLTVAASMWIRTTEREQVPLVDNRLEVGRSNMPVPGAARSSDGGRSTDNRVRKLPSTLKHNDSEAGRQSATLPATEDPQAAPISVVDRIREAARVVAQSDDASARCAYADLMLECAEQRSNYAGWAGPSGKCEGVVDADTRPLFTELLRLADEGSIPAALMFAQGRGLTYLDAISRPADLRIFRDRAPEFAWRAMAAGRVEAAVLLYETYNRVNSEFNLLVGAISPDPARAYALDVLMKQLDPGHIVSVPSDHGLPDVDAARAVELATSWAQSLRPFRGELTPGGSTSLGDSKVSACSRDTH
jgi:hypothetical protein